MDNNLNPQDIAEILGVSRQYVYQSGKADWNIDDIRAHAENIVNEAKQKAGDINTRLRQYIASTNDVSFLSITEADKKRFMKKVSIDDDTGCWHWVAGKAAHGYGQFRFRHKQLGAHRFSYWMHTGDYPGALYVCHSCNTKDCVNPEHLFIGTQQDNMDHLKETRQETQNERELSES